MADDIGHKGPTDVQETAEDTGHKQIPINVRENLPTVEDTADSKVDRAARSVRTAVQDLSPEQRKEVAERAGLLPDQPTTNEVWRWVVGTFCLVALLSTLAVSLIALGVDISNSSMNAQIVLTIFTTTVGFLAGLFTPSPAPKG